MNTVESALDERDAARLRRDAAVADAAGVLTPRQQALIHRRGWLRMLAPRACGGLELALPAAVRLEESIAAADGSCGWVVTLCAGAGWFAGFLPPALARQVVATRRLCIAGSGAPTGRAVRDGDGWRIAGRWAHASGAPMATHFTLNAVLHDAGGAPLAGADGAPRVRAFIVPARDVEIEPDWQAIGLRATASHAYAVHERRVPADHGFEIDAAAATAAGTLYRFPFLSLAYVTLAANLLGMARRFVALAEPVVLARRHLVRGGVLGERPEVRALLQRTRDALDAARADFYAALDGAWRRLEAEARLGDADTQALASTSLALVQAARDAVDGVYPYAGLHAAHAGSDLNRVWRDFHTATQHALFLPA